MNQCDICKHQKTCCYKNKQNEFNDLIVKAISKTVNFRNLKELSEFSHNLEKFSEFFTIDIKCKYYTSSSSYWNQR